MIVNSSVYVFGCFGNGYTQYPDDYTRDIFQQKFYTHSTAPSQIIIHRDNNLMYYGYIRNLDADSQYIGFCVLLNGVMFSQIGRLFSVFENAVKDLVAQGEILQLNERGDMISPVANLYEKRHEIGRISSIIQNKISALGNIATGLPPVSYGIGSDDCMTFSESDSNKDIIDASCKCGYTYICKSEDNDAFSMTRYKEIFVRLKKENENLTESYNELKGRYNELRRENYQLREKIDTEDKDKYEEKQEDSQPLKEEKHDGFAWAVLIIIICLTLFVVVLVLVSPSPSNNTYDSSDSWDSDSDVVEYPAESYEYDDEENAPAYDEDSYSQDDYYY